MKISTAALQRLSMSALCTVLAFAPTGNLDGASYRYAENLRQCRNAIRLAQVTQIWLSASATSSANTNSFTENAVKTSQAGIDLIKKHEGLRLNAYSCPAGKCTIGWGHTEGVKPGMVITKDQAEEFLKKDLERFEALVTKALDADELEVTQGQFDAMVALAFNVQGGAQTLVKSPIWRNLKAGDTTAAADCFRKFVYAHDKNGNLIKLSGLIKRREAERQLFLKA